MTKKLSMLRKKKKKRTQTLFNDKSILREKKKRFCFGFLFLTYEKQFRYPLSLVKLVFTFCV